jgi:hypothetical protein
MSAFELLSPVFALIVLTFGLMFWMAFLRVRATTTRTVRVKDIALGQSAWPPSIVKIDRAFHNQLELPLLFYLLVTFLLATRSGDQLLNVLSWLFVALRYAHAFVHTTSNFVPRRFALFAAGSVVLVAMWAIFIVRISWVY